MRVLIMTCSTGEGHNSCAKAIQQGFEENGVQCDVIDSLQFVSNGFARFFSWGHATIYRSLPFLFRHGYSYVERHPGVLEEKSFMYKVFASGMSQFYALLYPFDINLSASAHRKTGQPRINRICTI